MNCEPHRAHANGALGAGSHWKLHLSLALLSSAKPDESAVHTLHHCSSHVNRRQRRLSAHRRRSGAIHQTPNVQRTGTTMIVTTTTATTTTSTRQWRRRGWQHLIRLNCISQSDKTATWCHHPIMITIPHLVRLCYAAGGLTTEPVPSQISRIMHGMPLPCIGRNYYLWVCAARVRMAQRWRIAWVFTIRVYALWILH